MKIKNIWLHFKKICVHKYWVFYYCCKASGVSRKMIWRGLKHDMSKFSPVEFWESVKYYQGTSSPIDACKKANNGVSRAWMHHKGRNSHHYEYWVDDLDHGGTPLRMPLLDFMEMLCDYLGAGRAYYGSNVDHYYQKEYNWWLKKSELPMAMHPETKEMVTRAMELFSTHADATGTNLSAIFNAIASEYRL